MQRVALGAPSVATARRAARLRKDTGGTRVGACCDDAVHSRQGAHHGSCQTAACVNCKATCMRPVHACTCMRPRTLGLCLHVHASCACTVCVHGFFRCVHHVSTMYGVACTGCPVWMCVSTGGVRRARFYLRMRVHRSGCIPHTYILKVVTLHTREVYVL